MEPIQQQSPTATEVIANKVSHLNLKLVLALLGVLLLAFLATDIYLVLSTRSLQASLQKTVVLNTSPSPTPMRTTISTDKPAPVPVLDAKQASVMLKGFVDQAKPSYLPAIVTDISETQESTGALPGDIELKQSYTCGGKSDAFVINYFPRSQTPDMDTYHYIQGYIGSEQYKLDHSKGEETDTVISINAGEAVFSQTHRAADIYPLKLAWDTESLITNIEVNSVCPIDEKEMIKIANSMKPV